MISMYKNILGSVKTFTASRFMETMNTSKYPLTIIDGLTVMFNNIGNECDINCQRCEYFYECYKF